MLSILNELTLQKKLQNFLTNNVVWTKSKIATQQKRKSNTKVIDKAEN